jgi:hypothetical protein
MPIVTCCWWSSHERINLQAGSVHSCSAGNAACDFTDHYWMSRAMLVNSVGSRSSCICMRAQLISVLSQPVTRATGERRSG